MTQKEGAKAESSSSLTSSFGDYELLEKVGQGGMGVVYRARQISLGRIVAVKLLPSGPFHREDAVQRFRTEASASAGLQHPNIVAIHEVGEHEGQPYFTMDFIKGQTLAEAVRDQPWPAKRAATYLKAIAEAVHYAHQHGILHRDLKPSNVLIDAFDQPRITDFGLAKRFVAADVRRLTSNRAGLGQEQNEGQSLVTSAATDFTLPGQVLGSPNFMSPEQAEGRTQAVGPASDIYSLGALLYHLLTRQPPFQADTLTTLLKQVIEVEPVPPRLLNPSIPRDLETVCLKCLEKDAGERYVTAQALADELSRYLEGQPVLARPVGRLAKAARWARRNPRLASAMGAVLLSLLIGLAGVSWQWLRAAAGELLARQNVYAADMLLAQHALTVNNRGLAVSLLDKHRPAAGGKSAISNRQSAIDLRGWEWRYLWQLCQGDEQFTLHKYPVSIGALAVSQDRTMLAVRHRAEVALWDVAGNRLLTELPNAASDALAFSPTDQLLAVGSRDAQGQWGIDLWDVRTGRFTQSVKHKAEVMSVAFSPEGKLLATFDRWGNVAVTELALGRSLTNFTVSPPRHQPAGRVVFSPDGSRLAIGEDYGRITFFGLGSRTFAHVQTQVSEGTTALAFSPSGDVLAASFGGTICLCDSSSGRVLGQLTNHTEWVTGLAFTPDGRQLVSASGDWTIRIWSVADRSELRRLQSSREGLGAVALLPDGKTLVTGGRGGSVCFWDSAVSRQKPAHTNLPIAFALESHVGVALPGYAREALDPRVVRRLGLAFTTDSRRFLTTDRNGVLGVWEVQPLRQTERLPALGSNLWGVALSPDGRWLAVGDAAQKVSIWDWTARRAVTNLALPFEWFGHLHFSRSGNYLLARVIFQEVVVQARVWRTRDWQEIPLAKQQTERLWSLDLSPDDRLLATGYADGAVKLWRFPTGECEATFTNHTAGVYDLRFAPDGRLLVSSSWDSSVRLWDVVARRPLAALRGHYRAVWGAALSPDGRRLATGGNNSRDGVILWDLETHRQLLAPPAEGNFFAHVTFSPDGNTMAATTIDGIANLWRAPAWENIEAATKPPAAP